MKTFLRWTDNYIHLVFIWEGASRIPCWTCLKGLFIFCDNLCHIPGTRKTRNLLLKRSAVISPHPHELRVSTSVFTCMFLRYFSKPQFAVSRLCLSFPSYRCHEAVMYDRFYTCMWISHTYFDSLWYKLICSCFSRILRHKVVCIRIY